MLMSLCVWRADKAAASAVPEVLDLMEHFLSIRTSPGKPYTEALSALPHMLYSSTFPYHKMVAIGCMSLTPFISVSPMGPQMLVPSLHGMHMPIDQARTSVDPHDVGEHEACSSAYLIIYQVHEEPTIT